MVSAALFYFLPISESLILRYLLVLEEEIKFDEEWAEHKAALPITETEFMNELDYIEWE